MIIKFYKMEKNLRTQQTELNVYCVRTFPFLGKASFQALFCLAVVKVGILHLLDFYLKNVNLILF